MIIGYTLFSSIYGTVTKIKIYQAIKQVSTNFKELKSEYAPSPQGN